MNSTEKSALIERRNKDERALIFRNLLNGIPVWKVGEVFRKSEKEVMDVFRLVARKITDYCFKHKMPPVFCDGIAVAQHNKMVLLTLLPFVNLDKDSGFGRVVHERIGAGNLANALNDMVRA